MSEKKSELFNLYEIMVASAEKVTDRRIMYNILFVLINLIFIIFYNQCLLSTKLAPQNLTHTFALICTIAPVFINTVWASLLSSFKSLNEAKFKVILDLEKNLPAAVFTHEWDYARQGDGTKHCIFNVSEKRMPLLFSIVHIAFFYYIYYVFN